MLVSHTHRFTNPLACSVQLVIPCSLVFTATGYLKITDLRAVQVAIWSARSKWYDIGVALCVSPDTLDVIDKDKRSVCDECFREMLKEWLRRPEPCPTWKELAKALRSPVIGYGHLADELPPKTLELW